MPELPEVEVTRRGLAPALCGRTLTAVVTRTPRLRSPIGALGDAIAGSRLASIERRAKYLIWTFDAPDGGRHYLTSHLGMSGSWRLWDNPAPPPKKHDHVDLVFDAVTARLNDPRRFSDMRVTDGDPRLAPPLSALGFEPFDPALTAEVFARLMRASSQSVKQVLLSGAVVVGCGNIYCSEALFLAGIDPRRAACRISAGRLARLLECIRQVLEAAIAAGGSTLRDFHGPEGRDGYFALTAAVYARAGQPCPRCGAPLARIVQQGRSTFFCPKCQR